MRELTSAEMAMVSGGNVLDDILDATRKGAEVGGVIGFIVTGTAAGAARGGLVGGALAFSYYSGYAFGDWLYTTLCY